MFNNISKICNDYYNQLPADGLKSAGLSALYSFTASLIVIKLKTPINQMPSNLSRAGLAAGIAFTAATINALTAPIFNYLYDNPNNYFNCWEEFLRNITSLSLTHILINSTTAFKVNLLTAFNLKNENFIIFSTSLIKIAAYQAVNWVSIFTNNNPTPNNINQMKNTTPVYVTA